MICAQVSERHGKDLSEICKYAWQTIADRKYK